ncbi:MAG: DUF5681 domain-containing protein [Candidatus Scalindua sp.]|jgi:hypothetical protein|nr:DUF5681 domain-containing protein [Candidatus Scalindua sp.]
MEDKNIIRHAGMFKPGQSGNPLGRPKSDKTIRDLARVHTKDALKTLSTIVKNPKASDTARVQACNSLLDRGWGKAPQYTENVNLGITYVGYLEVLAKQENEEEIRSVEVCCTENDL